MSVPPTVLRAKDLLHNRLSTRMEGATVYVGDLDDLGDADIRAEIAAAPVSLLVANATEPAPAISDQLSLLDIRPEFVGLLDPARHGEPRRSLAVCRGLQAPRPTPAPADFRVVAIMPVYNEEDIVQSTIQHLVANGIHIYLLDNWSTDDTVALAAETAGSHLVGHERFPRDAASDTFDLSLLLERVERIAEELDADWLVLNDADEIRSSPWSKTTLRDALYHVHEQGYSAVNYTSLNFALTDDTYERWRDITQHLAWFEPEPASPVGRLNTWRREPSVQVELAWSGGHTVRLDGLRIFPYNFLIRHYPLRSVTQAQRKIFQERLPRFPLDERLKGWHSHYDHVRANSLLKPTAGLLHFGHDFDSEFLLERLTGVGFEAKPTKSTDAFKIRVARSLKRIGALDLALSIRWRITGRAAK